MFGSLFKILGGKKKKRFDYKAGNQQLMTEISELREKQPQLFEGGEWAVPEQQQLGFAFGSGNQSMNNSVFGWQAMQNIYAKKHYGQLQSLLKNMQKHYTQTMGGDAQVTSYLDNADA